MPYLSAETRGFINQLCVDQMKLIDLMSTIQQHIDQEYLSNHVVNSDVSTRELAKLYIYAHHKGLKSLYYTRNKLLSVSRMYIVFNLKRRKYESCKLE